MHAENFHSSEIYILRLKKIPTFLYCAFLREKMPWQVQVLHTQKHQNLKAGFCTQSKNLYA